VEIVEPHMYDVDDAVAKIDGYIISIAGAAAHVGTKRMVRIDQVGRTAASALLLDEAGEVVVAPARATTPRNGRASKRAPSSGEGGRAGERTRSRSRGRRAPADSEDADVRREAGLHESATAIDSEPEDAPEVTADEATAREDASQTSSEAAQEGDDKSQGDGADDGLQSKPRRRGRRGGRRRSAAKAKATPE
jgi:ribonuclease G